MKTPFQLFLDNLEEVYAFNTGNQLIGLNFKKKERTMLLTVKEARKGGKHYVAFIEAADILGCLRQLHVYITRRTAYLRWIESKY